MQLRLAWDACKTFNFFFLLIYMCRCIYVDCCVHATSHVWKSEGNFGESVLYLHHMGSRDQTQVVWHGSRYLYPLSHLIGIGLELLILLPPPPE